MGALDGKVLIVTGGTSGIGQRIAELMVEEGAKVVVAARRQTEGEALEKRLGISFIRTDVSIEAEVKAMVDHAVRRFGRVDGLVNNAAVPDPMVSIVDIEVDNFDRVMDVNVRGVMLGMKHVAPVMLSQGSGSIVNIASVAGFRAGYTSHGYGASKAAVIQLTRSVAAELGEKGIRVNSISPGGIVTGIFGKSAGLEGVKADKVTDVARDAFASLQPIPRAGATDDIARAVVFLASDWSGFVNGHDFVVDGGVSVILGGGWTAGVAMRADLASRIRTAAAKL